MRVFDGTGREIIASLLAVTSGKRAARILGEAPRLAPVRLRVSLAQVVLRGPAMDLIVGKATELGVSGIIPLEGEHSVRRASGARASRWLRIVQEAAEQCGRRELPEIAPACSLETFLFNHPDETPLVVCDASQESRPLLAVCGELAGIASLTLLVGGEGGLSAAEVERLRFRGARFTSLGPRILRAETAALAALTLIQATLGDWRLAREGECTQPSSS